MGAEAFGHGVRVLDIAVAEYLESTVIVFAQQRQKIKAGNVPAKIRGNVADSQATIGRAIIVVREAISSERLGVMFVPQEVFAEQCLGVDAGLKVQSINLPAPRVGEAGIEFQGAIEAGECI